MSAGPGSGLPPLLRHHIDDLHVIGGTEYRWYATTDAGYIFTRVQDPGIREAFTFEEFDRIRRRRDYRFERGWFEQGRVKTRLFHGVAYIADCSSYLQRVVLYRFTACSLLLQRVAAGTASLSDESLKEVLPKIGDEIKAIENPLRRTKDGKMRKRRGGPIKASERKTDATGDSNPGCEMVGPKAFRGWMTRLRRADFDPRSLIPHYGNCGPRAPMVSLEVRALAVKFVVGYAANGRPKKSDQWNKLDLAIKDKNKDRLIAGLEPLLMPSNKWFNKQVDELDAFDTYAGRYTREAAIARFRISSGGLEVTRPLARVEMDEWEVSLSILAVQAGLWDVLPLELRETISQHKCYIAVAIDCYSRVILGMNLAWTASPNNALAALRMALSDKGTFADSLGTLTPWDMFGLMEELATDGGPSFSNGRFRRACLELGINPVLTIGGLPWMRGRVERFFSRAHTELIGRFSGRTFENVVRRGAYESEKNASLTIEDVRYVFVRYIVDIYHNLPHEGLRGKTPREVWLNGIQLYQGLLQPPDRGRMRAAFGIEREATLDHEGVRFLALHYQSAPLQQHRRKVADERGTTRVRMRVDPDDLGTASVQIGSDGPWLSVPCTTLGMEDVTLQTWTLSLADMRARFGPGRMRSDVIQETNRAIENLATAARHRAGIAPPTLTQEQLDHAEAHLALGMHVTSIDPTESDRAAISATDFYHDAIKTGAALGEASVDDSVTEGTDRSDERTDTGPGTAGGQSSPSGEKKWRID